MKRFIILFVFIGCFGSLSAQREKGLERINQETAKAYIGFLASDELEGREVGRQGGRIAASYIRSLLQSFGVKPLEKEFFQSFEACRKERQKRSVWQIHSDSIAILKKGIHRSLALNNVLGMIPGKRSDEFVIIGAHLDHLGMDPSLVGDQIYNGADDNASGVSAVLQIARAFAESGVQPERTVIFAFWDGEEIGLLGSRYFVQNCPFVHQIKGYLNFDMIGRNHIPEKPQHVAYFYTKSHPAFGEWLKEDILTYQLQLQPEYKPTDRLTKGSDNVPFTLKNIPVIWYHTDGHPDYHMPTDECTYINWEKVTEITKAAFLNAWKLANEQEY